MPTDPRSTPGVVARQRRGLEFRSRLPRACVDGLGRRHASNRSPVSRARTGPSTPRRASDSCRAARAWSNCDVPHARTARFHGALVARAARRLDRAWYVHTSSFASSDTRTEASGDASSAVLPAPHAFSEVGSAARDRASRRPRRRRVPCARTVDAAPFQHWRCRSALVWCARRVWSIGRCDRVVVRRVERRPHAERSAIDGLTACHRTSDRVPDAAVVLVRLQQFSCWQVSGVSFCLTVRFCLRRSS